MYIFLTYIVTFHNSIIQINLQIQLCILPIFCILLDKTVIIVFHKVHHKMKEPLINSPHVILFWLLANCLTNSPYQLKLI